MAFVIKQDDTAPSYVADLKTNGAPVDLTPATSATFKMRQTGQTALKVNAAMAIDADPATGRVQYDWQTGDTDTIGTYEAEIEILWTDGTIETWPNTGYASVTVAADLDPDA